MGGAVARFVSIDGARGVTGPCVVVDVLRAMSTAAYALAWGAVAVVMSPSLTSPAAPLGPGRLVRVTDGPPRPGADAVSSPGHLRGTDLEGVTLQLCTTHGTRGALAPTAARPLLAAGFVNAAATARYLRLLGAREITYVVTGDDGTADEDLACAQYVDALLTSGGPVDPAPYVRTAAASAARRDLDEGVTRGYLGVHPDDVELCLAPDVVDLALVGRAGQDSVVVRPVTTGAPSGAHVDGSPAGR